MPDFGLDSDEIRELASPGCPPAFIELAIDCVTVDPVKRPNIRQVLERLMAIEREIVEAQARSEKTYNVGSLTFTAKNTGRRKKAAGGGGGSKRPAGPGRIPSFQGQIEGPKYSDSEDKDGFGGETSDEDVDDTLARLSKLQIGNGRSTGSTFYLNADNAKGTSHLANEDSDDTGLAKPNTYSVIKGSKTATRSSIIFREPDFVEAPTITSSTVTIKPCHGDPETYGTPGSLPSLPSSWLRMGKKDDEADDAIVEAADPFTDVQGKVRSHFSDETLEIKQPTSHEDSSHVPEEDDSARKDSVDVETTPVDRFATIKSMSVPIPAPFDTPTSPVLVSPGKKAFSPHRFTLVKPGWRALWEGSGASSDKTKIKYKVAGQSAMEEPAAVPPPRKRVESSQGLAAVLPIQALSAGLLTRCHVCEKRLGLLKPYLACDDCQHV